MSEDQRGSEGRGADAPASDPHRVLTERGPRAWAPSFFGVVPEGSVRRRPSDALHLAVAVVIVGACYVVTDGFAPRHDRLFGFLAQLPTWIGDLGTIIFVVCTIGAAGVVIGALVITRNVRLAITMTLLAVATAAVSYALAGVVHVDEVRRAAGVDHGRLFAESAVWLAVGNAVLLGVAPYLVRPARRSVRIISVLAVVGAFLTAVGPLAAILGAMGVGWAMAAIASLVVGTPKATPTRGSVRRALSDLGIALDEVQLADAQTWGETRFVAEAPDGAPASVVVIGRDATDARLASTVWRRIQYRDAGPSVSASRSSQLEHRAYLLLLAAKAGVPVSDVVMAATAGPEELAVLVLLDPPGEPFSMLDHDEVDDALLDDAWRQLGRLHAAGISAGQVGPDNLVRQVDGTVAIVDLSRGSAGASEERRARDRVDLLVTTSVVVGDERAIAAADRALGDGGLAELLPLLESAALSPAARRAVPDRKRRLKDLRDAGAAWAGVEVPALTELRRVSPASLAMAALTFVGFYLIVSQFAGVDLVDTLKTAEPAWVVLAFLLSFTPQFFGTISMQGTVAKPLPFVPVLAEQFANNFTGLIGGTVANTALIIRFFQKQGLPVAVAASSGVVNSMANGIVEVGLITFALIFGSASFDPGQVGGGDAEQWVLLAIVAVGVVVGVVLAVPKLRTLLQRTVGPQVAAAKANLAAILSDPRKALRIFGGNLCSQIAYALVIDAALHAYGSGLPIAELIVINSLASLLGGVAPIPGGMGVIEAGLMAGMTAAGVPQATAVAATFTARACTAYLPPIWGWASLQWLRRNDYV